jgi:hypothetical protein
MAKQRRPRPYVRTVQPQVTGMVAATPPSHCKTVGSAYVGSNPPPATKSPGQPRCRVKADTCSGAVRNTAAGASAPGTAQIAAGQRPGRCRASRPWGQFAANTRRRSQTPAACFTRNLMAAGGGPIAAAAAVSWTGRAQHSQPPLARDRGTSSPGFPRRQPAQPPRPASASPALHCHHQG